MKRLLTGLLLMMVLLMPLCAFADADSANVLNNGGFEQVNAAGEPEGWYTIAYRTQEGYTRFEITSEKAHSGTYSAKITNANQNDARYVFDVPVQPERMYRVAGYVLVEDMKSAEKLKRAQPPFTTSSLQQEASRKLNFSTAKTMARGRARAAAIAHMFVDFNNLPKHSHRLLDFT